MGDTTFPPCARCGEPESGTCHNDLCRDCDMDVTVSPTSCRECLRWIIREEYGGPRAAQHRAGCSLATVEEYYPRTPEELGTVVVQRGGVARG